MIRRATLADHRSITSIAAEVYVALGDYGTIIPSWLEHPGVFAYVDEDADPGSGDPEIRGFILVGFYEPASLPRGVFVADLLAIAVVPAHQRQGIGRRLLDYAIHLAELAGRSGPVPEIRLTVADSNTVGQRLFTSSGFRILDEHHGSYDGGQRAIRMSRSLTQ